MIEPWMRTEWAIAQQKIMKDYGLPADRVRPEEFRWVAEPYPFKCVDEVGQWANGCYSTKGRVIRYNIQTPTVVRHEAGHAILHYLGGDWKCYEHDC